MTRFLSLVMTLSFFPFFTLSCLFFLSFRVTNVLFSIHLLCIRWLRSLTLHARGHRRVFVFPQVVQLYKSSVSRPNKQSEIKQIVLEWLCLTSPDLQGSDLFSWPYHRCTGGICFHILVLWMQPTSINVSPARGRELHVTPAAHFLAGTETIVWHLMNASGKTGLESVQA